MINLIESICLNYNIKKDENDRINLNFEFTKGVQSKSEKKLYKNTHRMCEIIYMNLLKILLQ